jgi:hypothetical protein
VQFVRGDHATARQLHWTCSLAPWSVIGGPFWPKSSIPQHNSTSPPLLHSHRQQLLALVAHVPPRQHFDTQITTTLLVQNERSHQSEWYVTPHAHARPDRLGQDIPGDLLILTLYASSRPGRLPDCKLLLGGESKTPTRSAAVYIAKEGAIAGA